MSGVDQEAQKLKVPPHSIEAEQSILGGLMLDNSKWDVVGDRVIEDDFYRQTHKLIFRVIAKLASNGSALDVVTVA